MTTITPQDREIAAVVCAAHGWSDMVAATRNGERDHIVEVQAAAASRIETERRIVEFIRVVSDCVVPSRPPDAVSAFIYEIASRIEAGEHREQQP